MIEKKVTTRIQQKHDVEANWRKAVNFVPLKGEIIVYDIDETYDCERLKVGDGETAVSALPFISGHPEIEIANDTVSEKTPSHDDEFTVINSITRDNYGHITTLNTKIVTLPSIENTIDTAGSSNTTDKIYLVGATSQSSLGTTTYSNTKCYAQGGYLYSNNKKVADIDHTHTEYAESGHTHDTATANSDGFMSSTHFSKLENIESEANKYEHPATHNVDMIDGLADVATSGSYNDLTDKPTSMAPSAHNQASNTITTMTGYSKAATASAIVATDSLNTAIGKLEKALDDKQASVSGKGLSTNDLTDALKSEYDAAYTHSTSGHAPNDAEKNQNAFSNVTVGSTTIAADSVTDTLTLVEGSNITITPDATNDKITIAATYSVATSNSDGLMSAIDKEKLDRIKVEVDGDTLKITI